MRCATCPVAEGYCLGEAIGRLCELARTRDDYRRHLASRRDAGPPTSSQPATVELADALAAVSACPHRGAVLPVSLQPGCGCGERTGCRVGRGAEPGRVDLRDCLACVVAGLAGVQRASTRA